MNVIDAAASRRQVKDYAPEPVDPETLAQVLEAGRRCSSGLNLQPWHFVVVRDRKRIEALAGTWPGAGWITNAPVVVAVLADVGAAGEFAAGTEYDIGQVVATITLAATGCGLATGQTACIDQAIARRALDAPDTVYCSSLIAVGVPAQPLSPIVRPNRRPYDEVVHDDRW